MRAPALVLAALVATLGAGGAAHAERTYSAGEVRAILDIIEEHAAQRRAKEEKKKADTLKKKRVRAAKLLAAFRIGAEIKAERRARDAERQQTRESRDARRERLRFLLTGGRSGSGAPVRRGR